MSACLHAYMYSICIIISWQSVGVVEYTEGFWRLGWGFEDDLQLYL